MGVSYELAPLFCPIFFLLFLFSLTIECSQLLSAWWGSIYSRNFDMTNLITNTIGELIGYFIFIILRPTL
ncbi:VanZ family protein [Lysinibacillus pakistanensis]|uniref:VanZ family protein n=1 Tax=Lysinibacillus pakistanensis TaxID=759811 RepID=A0AAX3WPX0_9BACI|nr:VanZ family protein [Lysinibacillus pakistanensis]MDM5234151.1 VanZ family protein [Lysinibacillus pakistanensis]WHY44748.1 VanZ family protein [Lysinibacillus pakistanensis]WHY49755.1 VanZ family protein [Lysinibacillus pakistanensis]